MKREYHWFLWGITAAVFGASMATFIKLGARVPSETMLFARFLFAIPCILPFAIRKGVYFSLKKVPVHLGRAVTGLINLYCYFYVVKMLPLVNAVTLSNTMALFMPLIVLIWLKQSVSRFRLLAGGIGFLGVIILLRPSTGDFLGWASLAGLGTGFFGALALFGVRQLSKTESTEAILLYYFLIAAFLSFFPMLIAWKPISNPIDWIYLIALTASSVIYQYAITKSYTHAPATKASILGYFGVVFSGLSGWVFFKEIPDLWSLLGVFVIIGGALLVLFDRTKPSLPLR